MTAEEWAHQLLHEPCGPDGIAAIVRAIIAEEREAAVSRTHDYWMAAKPEPTLLGVFAAIRART